MTINSVLNRLISINKKRPLLYVKGVFYLAYFVFICFSVIYLNFIDKFVNNHAFCG